MRNFKKRVINFQHYLRYTNIQDTLYVILDLLQPPEIPAPQKYIMVKSEKIFQKSSNLGELKQNY